MTEEWRPVLGFEGIYAVSNLGRMKSLSRIVVGVDRKPRTLSERMMTGSIKGNGYLHVSLRKPGEKQVKRCVHQLVAEAFLSAKTEGSEEVNHLDCNKLNNAVTNLEWCSHEKNMAHAWGSGRFSQILVTTNRITETLADACRRRGIKYSTAAWRLRHGLSGDAIFAPVALNGKRGR